MKKKVLIFYSFLFITQSKKLIAGDTIAEGKKKIELANLNTTKNNSFFSMLANMIKKLFGLKDNSFEKSFSLDEINSIQKYSFDDSMHELEKKLINNDNILKNHSQVEIRLKLYAMSDYLKSAWGIEKDNETGQLKANAKQLSKSIANANKFFELYQKAYQQSTKKITINKGSFNERFENKFFELIGKETKNNKKIDIDILKKLYVSPEDIIKDDFFTNFTKKKNSMPSPTVIKDKKQTLTKHLENNKDDYNLLTTDKNKGLLESPKRVFESSEQKLAREQYQKDNINKFLQSKQQQSNMTKEI